MGYQSSETHEEFRAQPGISEPSDPPHKPRGYLIDGHLNTGPSQVFIASGRSVFAVILCMVTFYLLVTCRLA